MEMKILKPFGPSILGVKMSDQLVNDINKYVDEIILDKKKSDELDHGKKLIGDVKQEFLLDPKFIKEVGWLDFLANCTREWIYRETKKKIKKFDVISTWVVRQFENEYNPTHWHSGHISGAGFLKVPKSMGNYTQIKNKSDKEYFGGNLNLIHGSRMFLSESYLSIKPEVGDFYFFPHYLMHTVYPFKGTKDERRSISFNAKVDDEIFNVYT